MRKMTVLVIIFFFLLNFATTGGHIFSIDDVQYFLHTENLALNHSIKMNPTSPSAEKLASEEQRKNIQAKFFSFQGKHWDENTPLAPYYDASPLLLPFITVPLYYLATATFSNPINVLAFFTNSIILSIIAFMIFITGLQLFKSHRIAFVLSLAFSVTTFVWPYNTGMMIRPLASLFAIMGFYFIITSSGANYIRPILGGLCVGFILLASAASIIILPAFVLYGIYRFWKNKKQVLLFLLAFFAIMSIQAILNVVRFGSPLDFGYGFQQDIGVHSHFDGIIGYIFSIGWGLPFNAPLLVLFPISIFLIRKMDKMFAIFLSGIFLITWFFHGTEISPFWSGYGGWGPRYFIIILPLLIISLGYFLQEYSSKKSLKMIFVGLAVSGFFVNLIGKLVWYMYGYSYGWGILKTHLLQNAWEHVNYDLQYVPITLHLSVLNSNYIQGATEGLSWGLAPCVYDLFIYCELGIIPFMIILIGLSVISYLIIRTLRKDYKQEVLID